MKRILTTVLFCLAIVLRAIAEEIPNLDILDYYQIVDLSINDRGAAEELILQATEEENKGNSGGAIELYERSLRNYRNPDWYFHLGELYFDTNRFLESQKAFYLAGMFGCSQVDFAFYNAACAASVRGSQYEGMSLLDKALASGYSYWNHLEVDPDIALLRQHHRFSQLVAQYRQLPRIYETDHDFLGTAAVRKIFVDMDGDSIDELLVLLHMQVTYEEIPNDTYLFCLYKLENGEWNIVNTPRRNTMSVPETDDKYWQSDIETYDFPNDVQFTFPFIIGNMDNEKGNEVVVLSTGRTYRSGKILKYDRKLYELGEIEGFNSVIDHTNGRVLLGRQITDYALYDGTSEQYNEYRIDEHRIEVLPISSQSIEILLSKKLTIYSAESSIGNLASILWFLSKYKPEFCNENWIVENLNPDFTEPGVRRLVNVVLSE